MEDYRRGRLNRVLAEVYKVIRHLDRLVNNETKRIEYCERPLFGRRLIRELSGSH